MRFFGREEKPHNRGDVVLFIENERRQLFYWEVSTAETQRPIVVKGLKAIRKRRREIG